MKCLVLPGLNDLVTLHQHNLTDIHVTSKVCLRNVNRHLLLRITLSEMVPVFSMVVINVVIAAVVIGFCYRR